jgi:dolichol kinase
MCGGDGLADIMGRGIRSPKLPWNRDKSVAGSLGMLLGGWVLALLILGIYILAKAAGFGPFRDYLLPVTAIALVATIIESLPLKDVDNITVTLAAIVLGHLLFR